MTQPQTADQLRLQADLERRRSSAGSKHANKVKAIKNPGHGNRNNWKREL